MNLAGVEIGPDQPCRVIAEIGNAHNGSFPLALRLIEECAAAGADLIKFQTYTSDELVALRGDGPAPDPWGSEGWTMRDLYTKAHTPREWFPDLVAKCEEVGVPWFSSVFGLDSAGFLLGLKCPAFKIAALDIGSDFPFELMLYMAGMDQKVPRIASSRGMHLPWADLTLFCPPGYPQDWGAVALPDGLDGVSYHGTEWRIPAALAADYASVVEVHVQLNDQPSELESNVSLTISQLGQLCQSIQD